jgi:hypothetical protein
MTWVRKGEALKKRSENGWGSQKFSCISRKKPNMEKYFLP